MPGTREVVGRANEFKCILRNTTELLHGTRTMQRYTWRAYTRVYAEPTHLAPKAITICYAMQCTPAKVLAMASLHSLPIRYDSSHAQQKPPKQKVVLLVCLPKFTHSALLCAMLPLGFGQRTRKKVVQHSSKFACQRRDRKMLSCTHVE